MKEIKEEHKTTTFTQELKLNYWTPASRTQTFLQQTARQLLKLPDKNIKMCYSIATITLHYMMLFSPKFFFFQKLTLKSFLANILKIFEDH